MPEASHDATPEEYAMTENVEIAAGELITYLVQLHSSSEAILSNSLA
jgi:hypothetical protein